MTSDVYANYPAKSLFEDLKAIFVHNVQTDVVLIINDTIISFTHSLLSLFEYET